MVGWSLLTNCCPAGSHMAGPVVLEFSDNHAHNHHAAAHDDRATQEHGLATDFIDDQLVLLVMIHILLNC